MNNRSDSIVNLAKALLKFNEDVTIIAKDSKNPHFKNTYASLSAILSTINGPLSDHGIVLMQCPGEGVDCVSLTTTIMHAESGEFIESTFSMVPVKKDPQGIGSCISYMRRYAITSILRLNVDDDDGNLATGAGQSAQAQQKSTKLGETAQSIKQMMELAESMDELKGLRFRI